MSNALKVPPRRFHLGVDEAGTGAWAGPFCIGATLYPAEFDLKEVKTKQGSVRPYRDSKKLSPKARERMRVLIEESAVQHAVGWVFPKDIEKHGQGDAWQICIVDLVKQIIEDAGLKPDDFNLLVDGSTNHKLKNRIRKEIGKLHVFCGSKMDEAKFAVCAASILAKTARDDYMRELHERYPEYGFNTNVGYGTEDHAEALVLHGRTQYHRPLTKKWDLADR